MLHTIIMMHPKLREKFWMTQNSSEGVVKWLFDPHLGSGLKILLIAAWITLRVQALIIRYYFIITCYMYSVGGSAHITIKHREK